MIIKAKYEKKILALSMSSMFLLSIFMTKYHDTWLNINSTGFLCHGLEKWSEINIHWLF